MPKDNAEYQFQAYWEGRYTKYGGRSTCQFDLYQFVSNLTPRAPASGTMEPTSGSKDGKRSVTS